MSNAGELCSEVNFHLVPHPSASSKTSETTLSTFTFEYPKWFSSMETRVGDLDYEQEDVANVQVDEDGDFVVKRAIEKQHGKIVLRHKLQTTLEEVGRQLWRGAFFLADYMVGQGRNLNPDELNVLEIGAGTGMLGIVMATLPTTRKVVLTDLDPIISLIDENVNHNLSAVSRRKVHIEALDLTDAAGVACLLQRNNFNVLLGSDLIYDDNLSKGILDVIEAIAKNIHSKPDGTISIYLSFEKRFNFTVEDLDVVAPAFEFFMKGLKQLSDFVNTSDNDVQIKWKFVEEKFEQYFCYERTEDLFLIIIRLSSRLRKTKVQL